MNEFGLYFLADEISKALDIASLDADTRHAINTRITRAFEQASDDAGLSFDIDTFEAHLAQ